MSLGDNDANILPFADCEISTDVSINRPAFQKSKYINRRKIKKKPTKQQQPSNEKNNNFRNTVSYIYFENTEEENNFLKFIPYTGPSNTLHLGKRLYLPQLISNSSNDSTISFQRFIRDYDRIITSSSKTTSLSIYLRFGISYIIRTTMADQTIPLKDFATLRNRDKEIKTAFYTCKGVTSPKRLLTTITKLNYHQISSNTYSYDVQLYGIKTNSQYPILHFQYDEQLQCHSVYYRPEYPINFDFIRNKTSSIFGTIDDSYSDIFDFRIQLTELKFLSKTDPDVLDILRGVPIDQVLFLDKSTHILHVSSKLQKFVKYLKCTRSSNYQNFDEQILISIGIYEEFQLNKQGQCESLMKASNTMTIELIDLKSIPSGKKLYDIGMWFSTLCQTCVDLPSIIIDQNLNQSSKWFSDIFKKNSNQSIKQMNVNQLTTYKTQKSQQPYTTEELTFVKKILQEENLRNILFNTNEDQDYDRKKIEQIYENIINRLKTSAAPSANEALRKVERAYRTIIES